MSKTLEEVVLRKLEVVNFTLSTLSFMCCFLATVGASYLVLCPHAFPYARTNISAALESSHLIIIHCNDNSVVYLGSIYSTNASGAEQMAETNNSN